MSRLSPHRVHRQMFFLLIALGMFAWGNAGFAFAEEASEQLAAHLLERIGVRRGVVAVLGVDDQVAVDLALQSELLVHVRDPIGEHVAALRRAGDEAGLPIQRLAVEQGGFKPLPYADNMLDAVIATQAYSTALGDYSYAEVLRVLRPRGVAVIGKALRSDGPDADFDKLQAWARPVGGASLESITSDHGKWLVIRKPELAGADDWSHWEKSPDNNPVSADTAIKAPYMTQFMAEPYYIGMPSITTAAGGRTFLAIGHISHHPREWDTLNTLIARNGYNGAVLWTRKLPEGYLVHRSAFIASDDTFYMIDGDRCLMLDAATGREQGEIRIPGLVGDWKWMVKRDDVLYVMAGKPEPGEKTVRGDRTFGGWSWADLSEGYYAARFPVGFGDVLAAYDLKGKKTLWKHKEATLIDSRGMALRDDKVYLYCPDRHLRALDAATGEVLWTNEDERLFRLIEQPGSGLTSTPGFRTACLVVATPDALIIQGQTRMNVVAVSTKDGYLLWTKRKITNNPNAVYLDGNVILGVGEGGTHVALDPVTGEEKANLGFRKTACTRLTACADSLFCRGEGTLRFDRESGEVLVDGGQRPACNDGAMPANGLLYLGPWQCDCNLSLIGNVAKCSAGDFRFDHVATEAERLTRGEGDIEQVEPLAIDQRDWPTFRGDIQRSAGTQAQVQNAARLRWTFTPTRAIPTAPVAAGGLVFTAGEDGKVRALDAKSGELRWQFATSAPIKYPPTIAENRAYIGSGDGYAYCLEAATGRLLWKFRAAPIERHMMVYGSLLSTWPVGSGVMVDEGVAYFAAGIIDHDGTYLYALDAKTGALQWQNNSSGHLSDKLRKGVSVQGTMSRLGDQLLLASGNQVSPAPFNIDTGECLAREFNDGRPKANGGQFVGVFRDQAVLAGGRILYSAPENVSTKGSFAAITQKGGWQFNYGGVAPAWHGDTVAWVNFKHGKLAAAEADKVSERIEKGYPTPTPAQRRARSATLAQTLEDDGAIRWQTDLDEPTKFEVVSLAVDPKTVVAVLRYQLKIRAQPTWYVMAFDASSGDERWRQELRGTPLPGGLLIDRDGQTIVTMTNGEVLCFGS
ncbi:MAG: PQQ-binding-like beta-propeller repeat protein [Pirellulaceae bacterium]